MIPDQSAIARATAAVFVAGIRTGSAVLVDSQHLLTSAHILSRGGYGAGGDSLVGDAEVEFFTASPSSPSFRLPVSRILLGPISDTLDVAVLELGKEASSFLPPPIQVASADRIPHKVKVFGYPLAESTLTGVWRDFIVAGPTISGAIQLDWTDRSGTFPGHSGSPVIDGVSRSLVGILIEGSDQGQFDRYLPVTLIARAWPRLRRSWMIVGASQADARDHFTRRALGQRSVARGGDLFRGRQAALTAIREWLTAKEAPGLPLVVMGQPGAGKSAVLARVVLSLEAQGGRRGIAFHARAATTEDFLTAVADLIGIEPPASIEELIGAVAGVPRPPSAHVVAVDALDEAASESDRRRITGALAELAVLSGLRVAIATRALSAGRRYVPGGLLPNLGINRPGSRNLVDLDTDTYFDPDDLHDFAAVLLAQQAVDHPGPPGAAWERYRADHKMCKRLAKVIAGRAQRNFLVAAMAAVPLSTDVEVFDPASETFDISAVPSAVGEGLEKYLSQLSEDRRVRNRGLLTALAYGRGDGLDDHRWLGFAGALGYPATVVDLDTLRSSPAADYLLQVSPAEPGGRQLTRLFHQALADELLAVRYRPEDEGMIFDHLLTEVAQKGWTSMYLQRYAADHAAIAGRLDELIESPEYLLSADPAWLTPVLDLAVSTDSIVSAGVYRQTAHLLMDLDPASRASQLEFSARRLGHQELAAHISAVAHDRPWQTLWSHMRHESNHRTLAAATSVNALTVTTLSDNTPVVIGGGGEGMLWVRRLTDGISLGSLSGGHPFDVLGTAVGTLPDGTTVLASSSEVGIQIWRMADGKLLRVLNHSGWALAVGTLPDGTPVLISSGRDGIRVWRLADGAPMRTRLSAYRGQIRALAIGALPDGTFAIVGGGEKGIRVWRLADGVPLRTQQNAYRRSVRSVALTDLSDGTSVIISGGKEGEICVSRLVDGSVLGLFDSGHDGPVNAVAVGRPDEESSVVVSGGYDGTIRLHHISDGSPVGPPLTGHIGPVQTLGVGRLPQGGPVIVSGGSDNTVRVWPLAPAASPGMSPLAFGQESVIEQLAIGVLPNDTPVIVTSGHQNVWMWRLTDGSPLGAPIDHAAAAIGCFALPDGTPLIVSGGGGEIHLWHLTDGKRFRAPYIEERGYVAGVTASVLPDGTPVIVSGGDEGVSFWLLDDDIPFMLALEDTYTEISSIASSLLTDGSHVIVVGNSYGSVHVVRVGDGADLRSWDVVDDLDAMAVATLPDGTSVVATGGSEGLIEVWRLQDGAKLMDIDTGYDAGISALTIGVPPGGAPIIVGGSWDGAMQAWRFTDGALITPRLYLPGSINSVGMHRDVIVAAAVKGLSAHRLGEVAWSD